MKRTSKKGLDFSRIPMENKERKDTHSFTRDRKGDNKGEASTSWRGDEQEAEKVPNERHSGEEAYTNDTELEQLSSPEEFPHNKAELATFLSPSEIFFVPALSEKGKGWDCYFEQLLLSTKERVTKLSTHAAAMSLRINVPSVEAWKKVLATAKRLYQYVKNCQSDHNRRRLTPHGLVAIDKVNEALAWRVRAARYAFTEEGKRFAFNANVYECAGKYTVNALLAERTGNSTLVEKWTLAAESLVTLVRGECIEENRYLVKHSSQYTFLEMIEQKPMQPLEYTVKAVAAEESGDNEAAYHWNQAAIQTWTARANEILSIVAFSAEKANTWKIEAREAKETARKLAKVAEYTAQATAAKRINQRELAHLWTCAARKMMANHERGRTPNVKVFADDFASKAQFITQQLAEAAEMNSLATQSELQGNQEVAGYWRKGAQQLKLACKESWSSFDGRDYNLGTGRTINPLIQKALDTAACFKQLAQCTSSDISFHTLAKDTLYTAKADKARAEGHQSAAEAFEEAAQYSKRMEDVLREAEALEMTAKWKERQLLEMEAANLQSLIFEKLQTAEQLLRSAAVFQTSFMNASSKAKDLFSNAELYAEQSIECKTNQILSELGLKRLSK